MARMRKIMNAVAYLPAEGDDKSRYLRIGGLFEDTEESAQQGRLSLKIDTVPVGNRWKGWINFYPCDETDAVPGRKIQMPEED